MPYNYNNNEIDLKQIITMMKRGLQIKEQQRTLKHYLSNKENLCSAFSEEFEYPRQYCTCNN